MRTIGGDNGVQHILLHLLFTQYAWSAADRPVLQRFKGVIPAVVPVAHGVSAVDSVPSGERGEAASGVICRVLEEDVMLGLGAELRHWCVTGAERV
jgi:hypothetical protein